MRGGRPGGAGADVESLGGGDAGAGTGAIHTTALPRAPRGALSRAGRAPRLRPPPRVPRASGGPLPVPDPAEVRRLVEAAVTRVLGEGGAAAPAAPVAPPEVRPARVVDWTKPQAGDTKPLAVAPPPAAG